MCLLDPLHKIQFAWVKWAVNSEVDDEVDEPSPSPFASTNSQQKG